MSRAVVSIGANLGQRLDALRSVLTAVRPWLVAVSPVYETPPWGPVPQEDFLNAIVIVDDPRASAEDWLARAHEVEDAAGRTRTVRWGPRTLDVDLIDVDGLTRDDPELTLPHPRAAQRAFVLVPWLAADPQAVLGGVAVSELLAGLDPEDVAAVRLCGELTLT